jgi:hypothetical protein
MKPEMGRTEVEMRSRFDFSRATRGRLSDRYAQGHDVTLLDGEPDIEDPLVPGGSDSQLTELAGKHLLIAHLVAAGLEVAEPVRDKGIDLIVYRDSGDFQARPVQMKASSLESFSLDGKYERFPHLLIAYVWNVQTPDRSEVYALTFKEAKKILVSKGYDKTESWEKRKYYFVRNAGTELKKLLAPYRMSPKNWQQKLKLAS